MQTTIGRQDTLSQAGVASRNPMTPLRPDSRCTESALSGRAIVFKPKSFLPPANGNGNGNANRALIEALAKSKIYQDYERAFSEATGLPVALRPVESWQLPLHGKRNENPF